MAEQPGIDLMRRRIERASRQAPPSRRPAGAGGGRRDGTGPRGRADPVAEEPTSARGGTDRTGRPAGARRARRRPRAAAPERLEADLPPVNLAIRVRRPLDDRLAEVIHGLRRDGVRTSKVELIEMLLWEMPAEADDGPARAPRPLPRVGAARHGRAARPPGGLAAGWGRGAVRAPPPHPRNTTGRAPKDPAGGNTDVREAGA